MRCALAHSEQIIIAALPVPVHRRHHPPPESGVASGLIEARWKDEHGTLQGATFRFLAILWKQQGNWKLVATQSTQFGWPPNANCSPPFRCRDRERRTSSSDPVILRIRRERLRWCEIREFRLMRPRSRDAGSGDAFPSQEVFSPAPVLRGQWSGCYS